MKNFLFTITELKLEFKQNRLWKSNIDFSFGFLCLDVKDFVTN